MTLRNAQVELVATYEQPNLQPTVPLPQLDVRQDFLAAYEILQQVTFTLQRPAEPFSVIRNIDMSLVIIRCLKATNHARVQWQSSPAALLNQTTLFPGQIAAIPGPLVSQLVVFCSDLEPASSCTVELLSLRTSP